MNLDFNSDEIIRPYANQIWKERKLKGDADADDSLKNWELGKLRAFYHRYMHDSFKSKLDKNLKRRFG